MSTYLIMWTTEIRAGNKAVVDSGFVTSFGDELVEITMKKLVNDQEIFSDDLTFVFEFRDNGNDPRWEVQELSDKEIKITVFNHRDGVVRMGGTSPRIGPLEPLEIGETEPLPEELTPIVDAEFQEQTILLSYQVSSRGDGESQTMATDLFYTIYIMENDK